MIAKSISVPRLLSLTIDPITRWFKRKMLNARIKAEYINLDYFKAQAKNAHKGQTDATKRIVNLETQLRDLR